MSRRVSRVAESRFSRFLFLSTSTLCYSLMDNAKVSPYITDSVLPTVMCVPYLIGKLDKSRLSHSPKLSKQLLRVHLHTLKMTIVNVRPSEVRRYTINNFYYLDVDAMDFNFTSAFSNSAKRGTECRSCYNLLDIEPCFTLWGFFFFVIISTFSIENKQN